ncbi:S-adenosylmethionine:tRNA ribosyltransferase-isomerase [Mesobacillus persicus]|uniref:S-adenosylmethionine:tRNA ribosyltransferase-isomerase n=1 Tax=Mesobacillus persicus TaxID=930146 RepID=A0A1H7WBU3_9BACI|nr:S-adenosylmethionine:tRNA ribosyltransferase-isomerase [Mesobacillus persicus]SEM18488.1 S-adenosylmethionine:tRNA ribosyltransferase-isomerase [Mesobacillus persicus]
MTVASAFEFELPQELNATHPPERRGVRRDHVRMMTLNKETGNVKHKRFNELPDCLLPGDLVILNNSRTLPAILRASLKRNEMILSAMIEVRLARRIDDARWEALIVAGSSKLGDILEFSPELNAVVTNENSDTPLKTILFSQKGFELLNIIYSLGEPVRYEYIDEPWDLDYYQTVFASQPGSVKMPSAGRAFSWELLFKLQQKGIQLDYIQLHTGLSYLLDDKYVHSPEDNYEEYSVSAMTMDRIQQTKATGGRVIAVGTTVVRALESAAKTGVLSGWTNLYIHREFSLKLVDGIITGFHEPKASHLDMLTAFVKEDTLFSAYHQALEQKYFWHEFGDMNLIL